MSGAVPGRGRGVCGRLPRGPRRGRRRVRPRGGRRRESAGTRRGGFPSADGSRTGAAYGLGSHRGGGGRSGAAEKRGDRAGMVVEEPAGAGCRSVPADGLVRQAHGTGFRVGSFHMRPALPVVIGARGSRRCPATARGTCPESSPSATASALRTISSSSRTYRRSARLVYPVSGGGSCCWVYVM